MRACAADRFGDLDQLTVRDLPRPTAGPRQLVIHVKAAAVNPADIKVLTHRDGGSFLHASVFPLILGFDFSGTIAEVGPGVIGRAVGDDVYGFLPYARSTRGGTFAEYVVVQADQVGRKPVKLTHEQAAAAATTAVTALQVLRDKARVKAGDRVLLHGASGGVGSFAIQIAKLLGVSVVATASAAKLDHVTALGAERAVDYKTTRLADLGETFAAVIDIACASSFKECAPLLQPRGTYVLMLPSAKLFAGMVQALFSSKRCTFLVVQPRTADLDQLATWFDEGKLTSAVDRVYPLDQVPTALDRQRKGEVRGKLAITI